MIDHDIVDLTFKKIRDFDLKTDVILNGHGSYFQMSNIPLEILDIDSIGKRYNYLTEFFSLPLIPTIINHNTRNINHISNVWSAFLLSTSASQPYKLDNINCTNHWNPLSRQLLCINRRPSPHRSLTVLGLLGNNLDGYITLGHEDGNDHDLNELKKHNFQTDISIWQKIYEDKKHTITSFDDHMYNWNYDFYEDKKLEVVCETTFFENNINFSEKTIRPMVNGLPFVIAAGYNMLKFLQDVGFKTFNPVIDESYDNEPNPYKRLVKISQSVTRFMKTKLTRDQIQFIKDTIEHNQTVLKNIAQVEKIAWNKVMSSGTRRYDRSPFGDQVILAFSDNAIFDFNKKEYRLNTDTQQFNTIITLPKEKINSLNIKQGNLKGCLHNGIDITAYANDEWPEDITNWLRDKITFPATQTMMRHSEFYRYNYLYL
jgi:hypothetical protein